MGGIIKGAVVEGIVLFVDTIINHLSMLGAERCIIIRQVLFFFGTSQHRTLEIGKGQGWVWCNYVSFAALVAEFIVNDFRVKVC